jgi:hypothetical protein
VKEPERFPCLWRILFCQSFLSIDIFHVNGRTGNVVNAWQDRNLLRKGDQVFLSFFA